MNDVLYYNKVYIYIYKFVFPIYFTMMLFVLCDFPLKLNSHVSNKVQL